MPLSHPPLSVSESLTLPPKDIPQSNAPPKRLHLAYLDGIRGLAALYVVIHHSFSYATWEHNEAMPFIFRLLHKLFLLGHYSVVIFIVLSGYCLMIPVVRAQGHFVGGVGRYLKRRALRIIPPYYASLALSLGILWFLPSAVQMQAIDPTIHWLDWLPAFESGAILSHLFLIHNLRPEWFDTINGPTWTIATEWQLYFALPLLVFTWKKWGATTMIVTAIAVGVLVHYCFPRFDKACPWFLGCFAMGAAAASLNFTNSGFSPQLVRRFQMVLLFLAFNCILIFAKIAPLAKSPVFLRDLVVGATTALFLVLATFLLQTQQTSLSTSSGGVLNALVKILQSRAATFLGMISYSLYLVHGPLLNTLQYIARLNHWNYVPSQIFITGIGASLSLGIAFIFYILIEKPFLQMRK